MRGKVSINYIFYSSRFQQNFSGVRKKKVLSDRAANRGLNAAFPAHPRDVLSLPPRNLLVFRRWNASNENLISCVVRVASCLAAEAASLAASRVNPPALITPSSWPGVKQILLITLFVCTGLLGVRARAYARLLLLLRCLRQSSRELLLLFLLFLCLLDGRRQNDAARDSTRVETISVPISHAFLINAGFFLSE